MYTGEFRNGHVAQDIHGWRVGVKCMNIHFTGSACGAVGVSACFFSCR